MNLGFKSGICSKLESHINFLLLKKIQILIFPTKFIMHINNEVEHWCDPKLLDRLRLRWGLKQSCSPRQHIFNIMSHATCMQGNWGNSRLLMVGSQIVNLTVGPSFGHNLCLKCPNGSCKPTLDIYIPRDFQWHKELLNPMGFDPYNCFLEIRESIGTPTPKMGAHLGMWVFIPSHSPTLPGAWDVILGLPSWPAPLQALTLVANPRLGLWQTLHP
jgi:hypothetical protein